MDNLILVKLGGSLITDKSKPFTPRYDVINRLAREIHEARKKKKLKIIVGHGGGSFPHKPAKDYRTNEGIINKNSFKGIALVQDAASKLNRIIVDALIDAGENAVSVQPSSSLISENGRIKEWYLKPVTEMLRKGLMPVPYGDVALDTKKGCCIISTEEILNYISKHSAFKKIILAGITNGVYEKDPTRYPDAKLIPEINSKNFEEIKKYLGGSTGIDVTGGMLHRVTRIFELSKFGVEAVVMSGEIEGNLENALLGKKVGTIMRM